MKITRRQLKKLIHEAVAANEYPKIVWGQGLNTHFLTKDKSSLGIMPEIVKVFFDMRGSGNISDEEYFKALGGKSEDQYFDPIHAKRRKDYRARFGEKGYDADGRYDTVVQGGHFVGPMLFKLREVEIPGERGPRRESLVPHSKLWASYHQDLKIVAKDYFSNFNPKIKNPTIIDDNNIIIIYGHEPMIVPAHLQHL